MTIVSIVGVGSAGISVAWQLYHEIISHKMAHQFTIQLFEKSEQLGTGIAYNTHQSKFNLMNSNAARIGITYEDLQDFYNWLMSNKPLWQDEFPEYLNATPDDFYPRKLVGLYLNDKFIKMMEHSKISGLKIEVIHQEVIDIETQGGQKFIKTKNGDMYQSDYIVFSTGNPHSLVYNELIPFPNYYHSFHKSEKEILQASKSASNILIIGTRLSAVDTVIFLKNNNFKGEMMMSSRDGVLPTLRIEYKPHELKYFNRERLLNIMKSGTQLTLDMFLDDLKKTLQEEVYGTNIEFEDLTRIKDTDQYAVNLRKDLELILKGQGNWQKMQITLTQCIDLYWQSFSVDEKLEFTKYLNLLLRYLNSMPVKNGAQVLELLEKKQLTVQPGLADIQYDNEKKKFIAKFNFNDNIFEKEFDIVVNSSGFSLNLELTSDLYANLGKKKMVDFNPFGLLEMEKDCSIKSTSLTGLYSLGHPTQGTFLTASVLFAIAQQGKMITTEIMNKTLAKIKQNGIQRL